MYLDLQYCTYIYCSMQQHYQYSPSPYTTKFDLRSHVSISECCCSYFYIHTRISVPKGSHMYCMHQLRIMMIVPIVQCLAVASELQINIRLLVLILVLSYQIQQSSFLDFVGRHEYLFYCGRWLDARGRWQAFMIEDH